MVSDRNHPSGTYSLAERLLQNLPGVISAKINAGPEGEIVEIHVLTDDNRAPKRVVRDVESALLSGFSIAVDHKRISVAQLRNPEVQQENGPDGKVHAPNSEAGNRRERQADARRLKFDRFELVSNGSLKCRAEVILADGGRVFRGVCEDTDTTLNRMKISAKAVLSALEEYLQGEKAFTLEELKIVDEIDWPVVMVMIGAVSRERTTSLVGTSFMEKDRNRSAALATLKAVNRYLGGVRG